MCMNGSLGWIGPFLLDSINFFKVSIGPVECKTSFNCHTRKTKRNIEQLRSLPHIITFVLRLKYWASEKVLKLFWLGLTWFDTFLGNKENKDPQEFRDKPAGGWPGRSRESSRSWLWSCAGTRFFFLTSPSEPNACHFLRLKPIGYRNSLAMLSWILASTLGCPQLFSSLCYPVYKNSISFASCFLKQMVVDKNAFIHKRPFFANKNVTFAKLQTPRLFFAGPMLANNYEDSFTTCQITPENHGSLLDSLLNMQLASRNPFSGKIVAD